MPDYFREDFCNMICYIVNNGSDLDLSVLSNISRRINNAFEEEDGPMLFRLITAAQRKELLNYYKKIWKQAYPEN